MRAHFRARPESGTGNLKRESLGKQMVEGVEAEGTRTTITIPANQIGNERAIEITSERWYSEELAAVIMSRELDPRSGETRYRLTNLSRAEPSRSLFEVPSDYTVEDLGSHGDHFQIFIPPAKSAGRNLEYSVGGGEQWASKHFFTAAPLRTQSREKIINLCVLGVSAVRLYSGITKPSRQGQPSRARSLSACSSARKEDDESVLAPRARFPSEDPPAIQNLKSSLIEVRLEREAG